MTTNGKITGDHACNELREKAMMLASSETKANLMEVRLTNVYGDRYRVDFFVKHKPAGCLYSVVSISESYFVALGGDGDLVNLTVSG